MLTKGQKGTEMHRGVKHESGEAHEKEVSKCEEGEHVHESWEART